MKVLVDFIIHKNNLDESYNIDLFLTENEETIVEVYNTEEQNYNTALENFILKLNDLIARKILTISKLCKRRIVKIKRETKSNKTLEEEYTSTPKEFKREDYTICISPAKSIRNKIRFSKDWQTDEICRRYCDIEDIFKSKGIKNLEDLKNRLDSYELFMYITSFIDNIDKSDSGDYTISFRNESFWLNCIKIDEKHYNKFLELKNKLESK